MRRWIEKRTVLPIHQLGTRENTDNYTSLESLRRLKDVHAISASGCKPFSGEGKHDVRSSLDIQRSGQPNKAEISVLNRLNIKKHVPHGVL